MMSYSLDDREKKIGFIYDTLTGFCSVMHNLEEDYKVYSQNYSEEALALLGKSSDFINSVKAIRTLDSIRTIDDEGINKLFLLSQQIAEVYHLKTQNENTKKEVISEIENSVSETFDTEIKVKEILYFLNNYKSLSNWEYSGHGSFIAKKNATLWELGGIYWSKLFELPENPNLVHIGDEIKLKKEVIDAIYEYSVSDVTGNYSFESKSPDTLELIYGIISFCAGNSNKVPKLIKYGFTGKGLKDTAEILVGTEETATKLSYFIQNYATEGQEEDVWKKFNSLVGLFGSVFSFFGFLAAASIEENKYQIVIYNQRRAFINSAQDEIKRIKELKSVVKESELNIELEYLRFLEKQIKMLQKEILLNMERDKQQQVGVEYYYNKYKTDKDSPYTDTRAEKSPVSYHNIDYHKLFEAQK